MKKQIIFIHGGEAYSKYENYLEHLRTAPVEPFEESSKRWSHTLRENMGDEYEVFMPSMPSCHNAKYEEWKIWFERHFEFLHDDVILIGWSQGGYFLVKYLIENEMPVSVHTLYLIASPFEPEDFDGEDGGDFNFDIEKVGMLSARAEKIVIMHSKDDFVVPYSHALQYSEMLPDANLVTFEDRNHFLQEEFPELIKSLKGLV